ncbi:MAG: TIGR03016 family PEP-CTERM system-associated outer membrane protein [Nitrospirae bacterium]|nr:TIGR03016 family PEP-CTERM system-associated outer membrane protein [Nitrospirota bacterium]
MKKAACFYMAIALLAVYESSSFAGVSIAPSVKLKEVYNDNLFLSKSGKEEDFITDISPGIMLTYNPNRAVDISLDYSLSLRFYRNHSELNDTSIRDTQHVDLKSLVQPFDHFFINLTDFYDRVPIDVRRSFVTENAFRNMTDSNIFTISPYIDYPLSPSLLSRIGYRYSNIWYKAEEGDNSNSHSAFIAITKIFPSKTFVTLNYDYLAYRPQVADDYDRHQGSIAIKQQITHDFHIWGEVGKAFLDFSRASTEKASFWDIGADYYFNVLGGAYLGGSYTNSLSEANATTADPNLKQIDFETLQFSQIPLYTTPNKDSITKSVTKRNQFDLFIKAGKKLKVVIHPYYSVDKELHSDNEDKITGATVDIDGKIVNKISWTLSGLWEKQKFLPDDERVRLYSAGYSLNYSLSQKVTASIGYGYNYRNSNIETNGFNNNIVWLEAKVVF